jgi:hypothetical protein
MPGITTLLSELPPGVVNAARPLVERRRSPHCRAPRLQRAWVEIVAVEPLKR